MKSARVLFLSTAWLWLASTADAQSDWPDADSIVGVSLVVVEHTNAPMPHLAQEGLTSFPDSIQLPKAADLQLAESQLNRSDSRLRPASVDSIQARPIPWSMQNWLRFLHAGVLSALDQPLTGPPLPPKPTSPLLNAPLLMRESTELPISDRRAVYRVDTSAAHRLLRAMHWYQRLDRRSTGPEIVVANAPIQLTSPWLASIAWTEGSPTRPIYADQLTGYLQLTQDQFTRAMGNLCLHKTHQETLGPLRLSHLAPSGYRVTCLEMNRAIEPNQWNYFDSETLGALLQVSTR